METLQNAELLEEFLLHLKLANRSENTKNQYMDFLIRFFSEVNVPVKDLTAEQVYTWLQTNGANRKETTVSTWISILSSFFTFCLEEEHIEQPLIKSRWRPRLPKPTPKYVEKGEFAKLKLQVESENLRDQALFEFLSSSGCRITETLMLNREDVDLKERKAVVKGKGNKIRTVHFSYRSALLLEKLFQELPEDSTAIFLNHHGERLTRKGAYKILSRMGKTVEMNAPFGPHRLRHTFATTLLSKKAELSFIAEELGHSQLSTTRVYARLPKEELVSMYRKFMG